MEEQIYMAGGKSGNKQLEYKVAITFVGRHVYHVCILAVPQPSSLTIGSKSKLRRIIPSRWWEI